jgi:hypothetical protein
MTWLEFTTEVKANIPVDAVRHNTGTMFTSQLKGAVRRVQKIIPFYRQGHQNWFAYADTVENGYTSIIEMPAGNEDVRPTNMWLVNTGEDYETEPCWVQPLHDYPWRHRHDLSCGELLIFDCQMAVAWHPHAEEFWVYPKIESDEDVAVRMDWNGVKSNFANGDEVPFDEDVALAAADFIKTHFMREVERDPQMADHYALEFRRKLQLLHTDALERTRQDDVTTTPEPVGLVACTSAVCSTT